MGWLKLVARGLNILMAEVEHRQKERAWRSAQLAIDLAAQRQREAEREAMQREWERTGGKKWSYPLDTKEETR